MYECQNTVYIIGGCCLRALGAQYARAESRCVSPVQYTAVRPVAQPSVPSAVTGPRLSPPRTQQHTAWVFGSKEIKVFSEH